MQKGVGDERVEPFALGLVLRAGPADWRRRPTPLASTAAIDGTTRAVKVEVIGGGRSEGAKLILAWSVPRGLALRRAACAALRA